MHPYCYINTQSKAYFSWFKVLKIIYWEIIQRNMVAPNCRIYGQTGYCRQSTFACECVCILSVCTYAFVLATLSGISYVYTPTLSGQATLSGIPDNVLTSFSAFSRYFYLCHKISWKSSDDGDAPVKVVYSGS